MLTVADFDQIESPLRLLYSDLTIAILSDIARRLGGADMTPTAAWQVERLAQSGMTFEDILYELEGRTLRYENDLREAFIQAGVKTVEYDNYILEKAGKRRLQGNDVKNLSPAMMQVLQAGYEKTAGLLRNLTLTTASQGQTAFVESLDRMHTILTTGTMSYDQVLRAEVKKLVSRGVRVVDYDSGHVDHVDVAARRAVLTGVSQTAAEVQLMNLRDFGSDLVQVSAHFGARNKGDLPENHEMWQGRVYSISGDPNYLDFYAWTGYGTGEGLCGWNCRHSFFPFFEGLSINPYTDEQLERMAKKKFRYNGKEYSQYDATQVQRGLERKVRQYKREAAALAAARLDNTQEYEKIRKYQRKLREFCDETGLPRQSSREGGKVELLRLPPKEKPTPVKRPKKIYIPPKTKLGDLKKPKIEDGAPFDPSRYVQLELPGVPPPDTKRRVEMKVREYEQEFRVKDHENIVVIDSETGEALVTAEGDKESVGIPEKALSFCKGNITLHNHPPDVPFSNVDVMLAFRRMEGECRVVTKTRVFRFVATDMFKEFAKDFVLGNEYDNEMLMNAFSNYYTMAIDDLKRDIGDDPEKLLQMYIWADDMEFYDKLCNKIWEYFSERNPYFKYSVEMR